MGSLTRTYARNGALAGIVIAMPLLTLSLSYVKPQIHASATPSQAVQQLGSRAAASLLS